MKRRAGKLPPVNLRGNVGWIVMSAAQIAYLDEWRRAHPRPRVEKPCWVQVTMRKRDKITGERWTYRHGPYQHRAEAEAVAERLRRGHKLPEEHAPFADPKRRREWIAEVARGLHGRAKIEIVPPQRGWK